jgi:hypothetical protein
MWQFLKKIFSRRKAKSYSCCNTQERQLDHSQQVAPLHASFVKSCSHEPKAMGRRTIIVHGHDLSLEQTNPELCLECLTDYFHQACAICAACLKLIHPGTKVGLAWVGAPHAYTHLTYECCETGALYCGSWRDGYLQKQETPLAQAIRTGQVVFGQIPDE